MNKIFRPVILFCLLTLLIFTGCKKNDGGTFTIASLPDLTTQVKSSVSGFVTDENDLPVNSATVIVGVSTSTTDKYGYFEFRNVDVVKNAAVVTVTKAGYFKGIKTYIASESKSAFFRIKLMPKTVSGTISGTTGGTVTLANGLSISIPPGGVVNATSNAAYSGTVNISARWINPAGSDLPSTMPGDLRGLNGAGNLQLLTTYGMAAVELTGTGGELLQLAPGKKSTLSLPIPASISASAPATIPLWYFDESKGLWKEEGSATRSGNNYVGEVSHFSFWNCDLPANYVQFNCTVLNSANQPIPHVWVKITVVNNPINNRSGNTDSSGYVSGPIPANAQLLLEIFGSDSCNTASYTQTFTTGNTNISLGFIVINNSSGLANISGTVINCTNAPVTNGHVYIKRGSYYYRVGINNTGNYNLNLFLCNSAGTSITLIADDIINHQQSNPVNYSVAAGNNLVPNIQACGTNTLQFVNYTINGIPYNYTYPADYLTCLLDNQVMFFIHGYRTNTADTINMLLVAGNTGTGNLQGFMVPQLLNDPISTITPPRTVTLTEFPNSVGEFLAGNFSLVFIGQPPTNNIYNINCNFRVRRNQ